MDEIIVLVVFVPDFCNPILVTFASPMDGMIVLVVFLPDIFSPIPVTFASPMDEIIVLVVFVLSKYLISDKIFVVFYFMNNFIVLVILDIVNLPYPFPRIFSVDSHLPVNWLIFHFMSPIILEN